MNGAPFFDRMSCAIDMYEHLSSCSINKQWAFYSINHGHPIVQSLPQDVISYKTDGTQFSDSHPLVFIEIPLIGPHIILLLLCRFPAAIVWRIISIIVDTSKAMFFRWTYSHIFKKMYKTFSPSITDSNASAAILRVAVIIFVITALFHIMPRSIGKTFFISHTCTMNDPSCPSMASTTDCTSILQAVAQDDLSYLAIAQTQVPSLTGSTIVRPRNNCKFPKAFANKIIGRKSHV